MKPCMHGLALVPILVLGLAEGGLAQLPPAPQPTLGPPGVCPAVARFGFDVSGIPNADRTRWQIRRGAPGQNFDAATQVDDGVEVATSGTLERDLRAYGPVLDGTRYFFRVRARQGGDNISEFSPSVVFERNAAPDDMFTASAGSTPGSVRLDWGLKGEIAGCADRIAVRIAKADGSATVQRVEPGVSGTNKTYDLTAHGAGDYDVRVHARHGGDASPDAVGRESAPRRATVTAPPPVARDLTVTIQQITANPLLTVTGAFPITVYYKVNVQNSGNTASSVLTVVTFPGTFGFNAAVAAAGTAFSCTTGSTKTQKIVSCTTGQLAANAQKEFEVYAMAPGAIVGERQSLAITAVVDPNNKVDEANDGNNTASTITTVETRADLTMQGLSSGPTGATIGQNMTYVLTVKNIGDGPAQGTAALTTFGGKIVAGFNSVMVRAELPQQVDFDHVAKGTFDSCFREGREVTCLVSSIAPGAQVSANIIVKVSSLLPDGTQLLYTATADPDNRIVERYEDNNSTTVTTTVSAADHLEQRTEIIGGSGGTAFTRDCGAGKVLTGLRGRDGLVIDAIGILCAPVAASGDLGSTSAVGTLAGGGTGTYREIRCAWHSPVVAEIRVIFGTVVHQVWIYCRAWNRALRRFSGENVGGGMLGSKIIPDQAEILLSCAANTQPGAGIRGRSGLVVDAIGLICDEP